jgi:hypothetical protein
MITDIPPKDAAERQEFLRSEAMVTIKLPEAEPLRLLAKELEEAMVGEDRRKIQSACNAIAEQVSEGFNVQVPKVRVLGLRPLEEEGKHVDELFGDYDFEKRLIRLWMRTAVLGKMTSYGTFLSTLCHELCHHLDVVHFNFENTYHTRGFYERAGLLYSHARGVPNRVLVWNRQKNGVLRINWPATMHSSKR